MELKDIVLSEAAAQTIAIQQKDNTKRISLTTLYNEWNTFAQSLIDKPYSDELFEFVNDCDVRSVLQSILGQLDPDEAATLTLRLIEPDRVFEAATWPLWQWRRTFPNEFWRHRLPLTYGEQIKRELELEYGLDSAQTFEAWKPM